VSLVARVLETGGISTVTYTNARDIAASAGNPRQIFLNYPLGNPAGRPHDPDNQRDVLRAGLKLLEESDKPGSVVNPFARDAWITVYRIQSPTLALTERVLGSCLEFFLLGLSGNLAFFLSQTFIR